MPVSGIHHLGIAVDDLDRAVEVYARLFGAEVEHREALVEQGADVVLLRVGGALVELLAPSGPDTPVGRFLAKRGPGMHHVAFEVADVAAELARLAAEGAELDDERPRRGSLGREIAFVHPAATGGV